MLETREMRHGKRQSSEQSRSKEQRLVCCRVRIRWQSLPERKARSERPLVPVIAARRGVGDSHSMNESIAKLDDLLRDIVEHLKAGTKPDRRAAVVKLDSLAAVATTLA